MAHIKLGNDLPGILGPMAFKPVTGSALCAFTEVILRGPSPLSQGERELIAGVVSYLNSCTFCHNSHAAAADHCLGEGAGFATKVAQNIDAAPVSEKMKALLKLAARVQVSGRSVSEKEVTAARSAGASDEEIHDTVLVAAAFCMFNRYVDGLGTFAPEAGSAAYLETGKMLAEHGYLAAIPGAR
jgi:uncharacterized peroxidase-related enzyme